MQDKLLAVGQSTIIKKSIESWLHYHTETEQNKTAMGSAPAHSVINVPIIAANDWISHRAEDMTGE